MGVTLAVRNATSRAKCYEKPALKAIAEKVCAGEGVPGDVEISVLFCTDASIRNLNVRYGGKDEATDVLAFEQSGIHPEDGPRPLGDIVISLDTVHARCGGKAKAMRDEVKLLFCHGLLHLIGFDHNDARGRQAMIDRQAKYLGCSRGDAWFRGH
ncbi:MAG: rRNA maturation RNase YbeY [Candidatus Hydrogenedentes bacterium]|nr:rRNA maturation RNase YbeY [Candidatus Hydrogenedentota bacterium]